MTHEELDKILGRYSEIELKHISGSDQIMVHRFEDNVNHSASTFKDASKNIFFKRHDRFMTHYFHTHDFLEIMFMYRGEGANNADSCESRLGQGDICIVTPGAWHLPVVRGENLLLNFCVRTDWSIEFAKKLSSELGLAGYLKSLNQPQKPKYVVVRSGADREIFDCACRLAEAFIADGSDSQLEEECIIGELLIRLCRCSEALEYGDSFSTDELFGEIIAMISCEYRTLTLDILAEKLNYSKAHLCRVIRKNMGTTFSDIVNSLRISEACRMLQSGRQPISEIAYSIGFSNIEYFNRTFKRYTKQSPSEYRQNGELSSEQLICKPL